jgi:hypothetical protein
LKAAMAVKNAPITLIYPVLEIYVMETTLFIMTNYRYYRKTFNSNFCWSRAFVFKFVTVHKCTHESLFIH